MPRKITNIPAKYTHLSPTALKQNIARETTAYNYFLSRLDYLTIIVYPTTGKLPPAIKTYQNLCKALTTYCGLTFSEYDYLLQIEQRIKNLWQE